ncbi:MAG: exopolyphosphatase [Desulfobacteraceae bacterium]|nr:exopolyphosphatase [Desulfobacteraceae bacterium]
MRIVTRPDFDGVVCAVLIYEAETITQPTYWVEPSDVQKGLVKIKKDDILANLPFHEHCALWFDHHFSNKPDIAFQGLYELAPSAAGLVFRYYRDRLKRNYDELVRQADKIDAADLSKEEVLHPENYPYILLSMTISGAEALDEPYWNHLVKLLGQHPFEEVMEDDQVRNRCRNQIQKNNDFKSLLQQHTKMEGALAITDFRPLAHVPQGNRFLSYCLFPESVVNLKIRYDNQDRSKIIASVGHSIFNRNCNINVGLLLKDFEGGGHEKAGACSFHMSKASEYLPKIIQALKENRKN